MVNRAGRACLHLAAYNGKEDMCRLLVEEAGANVQQGDKQNRKPLHWAVFRRHQVSIHYPIVIVQV